MKRTNTATKKANTQIGNDRDKKIKRVGKTDYSKPKHRKFDFLTED